MQIIIDTREQHELKFRKEFEIVREKLDVGDYGVKVNGEILPLFFERKGLSDLYGTLSSGYGRFKNEINRASKNNSILVLAVEVPLSVVAKGCEHSSRVPSELIQQCFTIMVRYKVPCMFFADRRDMAGYITQVFLALEREYNDSKGIK
jgi:ERCC4-type nuclease